MPNIASIIRDHVVLSIRCVDRLYVNGYLPRLQTSGQLVYFMTNHLDARIPSPALLKPIRERLVREIQRFTEREEIPLVSFQRGERKDDVATRHRKSFDRSEGVVFVGAAQERMHSFKARRLRTASGLVAFDFSRRPVFVNHYYFYFQDRDWGPGFLELGSYAPYPVKLCLNGHEGAKQQLRREGIGFESLDNGFLACEDPEWLQAICDRLGPADVQACFDRWSRRIPWPLSEEHRAAGYEHRLTLWQMETSLTQVFERPLYGRQFFDAVIREHLDLGRPDRVSALFSQRLTKRTPAPRRGYETRVFVSGVDPSIQVDSKRSHVKQYFKEQRALRTETTINDPGDVHATTALRNLPYLHRVGESVNQRLLDAETLSHDCLLGEASFEKLQRPSVEGGHRCPALRFGDRRVLALFQALCAFAHLPASFRHRDLRPRLAALLDDPDYGANQMTYDLRRLRRHGLIARIEGTHLYVITTYGLEVALFCSKLYLRVLRPAWSALETTVSSTPHRLRQAFRRLTREVDRIVQAAQMKNLTQPSRGGAMSTSSLVRVVVHRLVHVPPRQLPRDDRLDRHSRARRARLRSASK